MLRTPHLRSVAYRCVWPLLSVAPLVVSALVAIVPPVQAEESNELTQLLPNDINALAIVRVEEIMQTPRAMKEDWARAADQKFLSGAGGIPSWVKTLVVGFQIRPAVLQEVWAAGVASIPPTLTIDMIAQREQVSVEQLGRLPAVHGRRNSYLIGIEPGVLGIWRPAIRQEAARWGRALEAKVTGPLSEYLTQAAAAPGHLVLAVDLENTLDPVNTRAHLAMMPELNQQPERLTQMQTLLMSLRGATLTATIADKTTAHLRLDFQNEIGPLESAVKAFFINTLHELGAAIDDFNQASPQTDGKGLILTTELSDESLRRLVSLITSTPTMSSMNGTGTTLTPQTSPGDHSPDAAASSKYFKQIDQFVNDLSKASRRSNDYSRTALWHEKFAGKIDELPMQGVDPVLVEYAGHVASRLRALGRSLRGQQLDINLQQGTLTYDVDYTPGWASVNVWGGVGYGQPSYQVNSNLQQVRERQAAAISAGEKQRDEVWGMLTEDRLKVLRQMQQKYGDDFGK